MKWQAVGASVQGTSHTNGNTPCQDSHAYLVAKDYVIAAVADGLGSAAVSEQGSRLAVETALHSLNRALTARTPSSSKTWTEALEDSFSLARQGIERTAETNGLPLREYGTTLISLAITSDWVAVGHLGDGAVVGLDDDGRLETISPPQRGEYANEVTPLTADDALKLTRFTVKRKSMTAVALITDGLQMLSLNSAHHEPYSPFFTPFFESICQNLDSAETSQQLERFLTSERVCERTDDDKTLVVVGKVCPSERPQNPVNSNE